MSRFDDLLQPKRPLTEVAADLIDAFAKWHDAIEKLAGADAASLRKNTAAIGNSSNIALNALAELRARLNQIANEPLPQGTSSVSKCFLEDAPTNGAMHAAVPSIEASLELQAALAAARAIEQAHREAFDRQRSGT